MRVNEAVKDRDIINIVFAGEGVTPETLDASRALDVALKYVRALETIAAFEWGTKEAPFIATFVGVKGGSASYEMAYTDNDKSTTEEAEKCWRISTENLNNYAMNPQVARKQIRSKLEDLNKAVRNLPENVNANVRFRGSEWSMSTIAKQPEPQTSTATSTFRGRIIRVGGKTRPRVQVSYMGDNAMLSADASIETSRIAGNLLYKSVDITATLTRSLVPPNYPVVAGKILNVREVPNIDAIQAFDKWYEDIGRPLRQYDEDELDRV